MKTSAIYQIIAYLVTGLTVLVVGAWFDFAFCQSGFYWKHLFGNRPLPIITEFFVHNYHLSIYLTLFPWLGFVGAPLLTENATRQYWDVSAYVLRFIAFVSVEFFLILILAIALTLPFVPYYGELEPSHGTGVESVFFWGFWSALLIVMGAPMIRLSRRGRHCRK